MLTKLLVLAGATLLLGGCTSQNGEDLLASGPLPAPGTPSCDTTRVTYATTVAPLLLQSCGGCHGNGVALGGVALGSYAQVKTVVSKGRLLGAVDHAPGYSPMPKGGAQLSACDRAKLRLWVRAGAPNN
jgi:mono/diheme cytochrome c family protein